MEGDIQAARKHCQVEVQEKYYWTSFLKYKISNTIDMLFIVYSNKFLQNKCVFPYVRSFTLIYGPF